MNIKIQISIAQSHKMYEVNLPEQKTADDIVTALFDEKYLKDRDVSGNDIKYVLMKNNEYLDTHKPLYAQGIINGDILTVVEDVGLRSAFYYRGNKPFNINDISRVGCFVTGVSLIGAGLADAFFNDFHYATAPELFSAGITLISISLTGDKGKKIGKEAGNE